MTPDPTPLTEAVTAFITRGEEDPAAFDRLARAVFAYQYRRNGPYRTFCDGRGAAPENLASWQDIPAAPAVAFKRFALTCAEETACRPEAGGRVFHSSGTTGGGGGDPPSRHFMDAAALDLYRVSLRAGFRRFVVPDGAALPILALLPPPAALPHSSLSFMLGELITDYGGRFFWEGNWQEELSRTLRLLTGPVIVFGTAFAFVHFFDVMDEQQRFALPPGSRVIETGGFKGRSREVSRDDLYALFLSRLGVGRRTHCLSEYGMSEMASQFYDSVLHDEAQGIHRVERKIGPPWLRTRVVDPVTGEEAAPGQPGLLVHYDLANLNSVLALQTEDWGHAAPDGEGFMLLGRAPGAVLRGCSLTAEEMASRPEKGGGGTGRR